LARALGIDFHLVEGIVHASEPGAPPPRTAADHAEAFLCWLQAQPPFPGNEVPARLIEHRLFPYFAAAKGIPHSWRSVARYFANLHGVRRRQIDGRVGSDRSGSSTTVYLIPTA
jgi:hypothetical protein